MKNELKTIKETFEEFWSLFRIQTKDEETVLATTTISVTRFVEIYPIRRNSAMFWAILKSLYQYLAKLKNIFGKLLCFWANSIVINGPMQKNNVATGHTDGDQVERKTIMQHLAFFKAKQVADREKERKIFRLNFRMKKPDI